MRSRTSSFSGIVAHCQFIVAYFCDNPLCLLMIILWGAPTLHDDAPGTNSSRRMSLSRSRCVYGDGAAFTALAPVVCQRQRKWERAVVEVKRRGLGSSLFFFRTRAPRQTETPEAAKRRGDGARFSWRPLPLSVYGGENGSATPWKREGSASFSPVSRRIRDLSGCHAPRYPKQTLQLVSKYH